MLKVFEKNSSLIKDIVLAGNDGVITTFAIVAGSIGASLPASTVIILGFANLFADGLSMATGSYLGSKSEQKFKDKNESVHQNIPLQSGVVTFISFFVAGLFPILPYLFSLQNSFLFSSLLVFTTLTTIGLFRGLVSGQKIYRGILENLVIGGIAAVVAFLVGGVMERYLLG